MEKYISASKKFTNVEEMMTSEQKTASEMRERFKFQERDPFDDFIEHIDQNTERRLPTSKEKERMDESLIRLGKFFLGSDIKWHIDGALNISLLKGEYIGVHKDVDISIERDEIERIDGQLKQRGYGLFLSYRKDGEELNSGKIMERVGSQEFSEARAKYLMIAAIDERGKIRNGEALNFIDVHITKRNKAGKIIGWGGVELPDKWFESFPIKFKDQEIHLSHPAKVAYFKIHNTRTYDRTDLRELAEIGILTINDINEIEQIFQQETQGRRKETEILLGKVADKLNQQMSSDEIFDIFAKEPVVAEILDEIREPLKILSQRIEAGDKSRNEVLRLAFEVFNLDAPAEKGHKNIKELKIFVENSLRFKKLYSDS